MRSVTSMIISYIRIRISQEWTGCDSNFSTPTCVYKAFLDLGQNLDFYYFPAKKQFFDSMG